MSAAALITWQPLRAPAPDGEERAAWLGWTGYNVRLPCPGELNRVGGWVGGQAGSRGAARQRALQGVAGDKTWE